ncbi:MAG: hypothetical protein ACMUIP_08355 [bacterium]
MIEIGIAIIYWVLESFVHVYIFYEGTLQQQLFTPDIHEIWMRSLTILLIFISNLVCVRYPTTIAQWLKKKCNIELSLITVVCFISLFFGAFYWIFESFVHVYIFREGTFVQQLLFINAHEIWMRSLALIFIFGFNLFAAVFHKYSQTAQNKKEFLAKNVNQ